MPHDRGAGVVAALLRRATGLILAAGALLWLCACIGDAPARKVAGGTGSEAGDAYGVAWSISSERVAPSARVALYASNDTAYAHPTLQAEGITDAQGGFHLAVQRAGEYALEIRDVGDEAILYKRGIRIAVPGETDLGRLSMPAVARFRGKLAAPPVGPTRIWLEGTPYSAAVDSLGRFDFATLPSGTYRMFSERAAGDSLARVDLGVLILNPGDSLAPPATDTTRPDTLVPPLDTVPVVPMDTVLIENFDDGGEYSSYGRTHGDGLWTASAEGGMPMYPATGGFDEFTTITNGGAGKSLAVAYTPVQASQKAIVEINMGSKDMDGPVPDSVVFWAKGRGKLVVDALLWAAPTTVSTGARTGSFTVTLTAAWKEYRFPVIADTLSRRTGYLRFTGSSGESYFLDEIIYKGAK